MSKPIFKDSDERMEAFLEWRKRYRAANHEGQKVLWDEWYSKRYSVVREPIVDKGGRHIPYQKEAQ